MSLRPQLPIDPILFSLLIKHANQQGGRGMKLFISVDMEGTTGLERLEEIFRGLPGFDTFRQLMAGDCNAVIQGAIEGGASEIVVSDSHGYMCNMRPDDLV
jgi:D-amino peptidase